MATMTHQHDTLTRICAACGMEKPLSVFLQMSDAQGTSYSALCATCRGANASSQAHKRPDDERTTTTTSGNWIGAKEKVAIEKQHFREMLETKQQHQEETKKREALFSEKNQQVNYLEKDKSQREEYLAAQKEGLLKYQPKQPPTHLQNPAAPTEKKSAGVTLQSLQQQHVLEEKKKVDSAVIEEKRNNEVDFSSTAVPGQQAKYSNNATIRAFASWVGSSAPVVSAMSQIFNPDAAAKKQRSAKQAEPATNEKKWSPSSPLGRKK